LSASSPRWLWACFAGSRAALNHGIAPWILTWIVIAFAGLVTAFASGCSRAVLVPESSPIRIGPETEARVYTRVGGEWVLSENRVSIPEGWYCVPPSFVEE
jgi:hypothetical protein